MTDQFRVTSYASAAVLALVLGQTAFAQQPPAAPPAPKVPPAAPAAPVAPKAPAAAPATTATPAVAAPASPVDAARAKADERRAAADAERTKRYAELRARAADMGLDLPETPPWEGGDAPKPPQMPSGFGGMTPDEMKAMRAEHQALREKMKNATPEERRALREEHWKKMRERAAARGVEMPETPPWVEAEKRYKEAQEQYEANRKIVDAMTEEQRKAAEAIFGDGPDHIGPMPPMPPMRRHPYHPYPMQGPRGDYGYGPMGGYPGNGPDWMPMPMGQEPPPAAPQGN